MMYYKLCDEIQNVNEITGKAVKNAIKLNLIEIVEEMM